MLRRNPDSGPVGLAEKGRDAPDKVTAADEIEVRRLKQRSVTDSWREFVDVPLSGDFFDSVYELGSRATGDTQEFR